MKDRFLKDQDGKIVIWQAPNLPLYAWIIFEVISLPLSNEQLKAGVKELSTVFLFTWGYLEVTSGVNYFRRSIGGIVLLAQVLGFFMK